MPEEYISRKAAARILGYTFGVDVVRKLHEVPAADVAEVVRCKGCRFGSYDSEVNGAMVCEHWRDGHWRQEDDFCSHGMAK